MKERIRQYISNCLKYIEFGPKYGKNEGFLHSLPKGNVPFDTLHIDHYGPLEKSRNGNKHILSVIDGFTKFIKLYPCKSTKTEEVTKHLSDYFQNYSLPKRVITDRGTCFKSNKFFRNLLKASPLCTF